jgi:ABC-type sulfate transport system permease component
MVTPFLVIRSGTNVAFAVIYVYLAQDEQTSAGVISAVLLGITAVVLYAGLVFMGFEKDWNLQYYAK